MGCQAQSQRDVLRRLNEQGECRPKAERFEGFARICGESGVDVTDEVTEGRHRTPDELR